jgi:hypothetical protein
MVRMFVPLSRRWVAKLCLRVWTVTCLPSPASRPAWTHACHTDFAVKGRSATCPGKSQCFGLATLQYSRFSEYCEQSRREHHLAVFVSFALADADDHPTAIDVGDLQGHDLRDTESGGVGGHEDGTML